jgi:hypothetical protein
MAKTPRVFISYAREDRTKAEQIYDNLTKEGFSPWIDTRDLPPGSKWQESIERALRDSDFILALLSNNSISKRGYIQRELRAALSLLLEKPDDDIFLIPVRLEECPFPASLAHIQSVDLFEEGGWHRLLEGLKYGVKDQDVLEEFRGVIESQEEVESSKRHIFVAMPFKVDMEDIYHYGISHAVNANGFACERVDLGSFTGSILQQVRERIETAAAVIADLTGANPNVHLELGYAWGKRVPTILLIQNINELCFDVRDQRCIEYRSIKALEDSLTRELAKLKAMGRI